MPAQRHRLRRRWRDSVRIVMETEGRPRCPPGTSPVLEGGKAPLLPPIQRKRDLLRLKFDQNASGIVAANAEAPRHPCSHNTAGRLRRFGPPIRLDLMSGRPRRIKNPGNHEETLAYAGIREEKSTVLIRTTEERNPPIATSGAT